MQHRDKDKDNCTDTDTGRNVRICVRTYIHGCSCSCSCSCSFFFPSFCVSFRYRSRDGTVHVSWVIGNERCAVFCDASIPD